MARKRSTNRPFLDGASTVGYAQVSHAFVFDDDGHLFIDCEKDGTLRAVLVGMQHQAEGALPVT